MRIACYLAAGVLSVLMLPSARAFTCSAPANPPACSYTALNGSCKITIDRMSPVTPPTIYVKRSCTVTVEVTNSNLLEELTLDWKSSVAILKPDQFQALLNALSGDLGKIVLPGAPAAAHAQYEEEFVRCEDKPRACTQTDQIVRAQKRVAAVIGTIDPLTLAADDIKKIKSALQPPSIGAAPVVPFSCTNAKCVDDWRNPIVDDLDNSVSKYRDATTLRKINTEIKNLDEDIKTLKESAERRNDDDQLTQSSLLEDNQTRLKAEVKALPADVPKLQALADGVRELSVGPGGIVGNHQIPDPSSDKQTYVTQTFTLNYTNKLLPVAKRVAADTLRSENSARLGSLADAPSKQSITDITVQFQSAPRLETAAGLMVPFTPYHGYSVAAQGSNGAVTDNVVQENKTYVVVPMALVNVLAKEWILNHQRSAFFGTGGIGYNPSSSTVEFGVGGTYSYRSFEFSLLADIGRDTKLGGGFTVNQSLGTTSPVPNPITSTYWSFKPAAGFSVRIPLGGSGGSSSSSSSGGSGSGN